MTSTALTTIVEPRREATWVGLMAPAMELANMIKATEFVPKGLRGNAPAIVAALLTADELGVGGMTGLANIHVIDGKPTLSASLMRALVVNRGHDIWFEDLKTTSVTACGRRRGSEAITKVTWTMEMARTAMLLGKDNWKKYQRSMLEARASSELCRLVFADCLAGLLHSTEEIEDGVITIEPGGDTLPGSGSASTRRRRPAPPSVESVEEPVQPQRPALPGDAPPPSQTQQAPIQEAAPGEEQESQPSPVLRKLFALFGELTIKDRGDRLAICSLITKRAIASSKDLTADEVSVIVEMLEGVANSHVLLVKRDGIWKLEDAPGDAPA